MICRTRFPNTARTRMLASSASPRRSITCAQRDAPLEIFEDFILGDSRGFHFPLEARCSFFESFMVRFGPLAAGRNVITDNVTVAGYRDGLVRFQDVGGKLLTEFANTDFQGSHKRLRVMCTYVYTNYRPVDGISASAALL